MFPGIWKNPHRFDKYMSKSWKIFYVGKGVVNIFKAFIQYKNNLPIFIMTILKRFIGND